MKLIIVGKGNGWWDAPKEGEVWGINEVCIKHPCTRVFDMHDLGVGYDNHLPKQLLLQTVVNRNIPLISIKKYEGIATSEVYPLEEVEQRFDTSYFSNGICYMVALALYEGYTDIQFYGVNMHGTAERFKDERPCVEWWLGIAKGMGVKVTINKESSLLRTYDGKKYGYNTWQFTDYTALDAIEQLK